MWKVYQSPVDKELVSSHSLKPVTIFSEYFTITHHVLAFHKIRQKKDFEFSSVLLVYYKMYKDTSPGSKTWVYRCLAPDFELI